MLHHLLQQSGADLGFHTPSPANSARRLGSALLSEKNGDVDHKTVLHLKENKSHVEKVSVMCVQKQRRISKNFLF